MTKPKPLRPADVVLLAREFRAHPGIWVLPLQQFLQPQPHFVTQFQPQDLDVLRALDSQQIPRHISGGTRAQRLDPQPKPKPKEDS